jgi:hypothetical protein
MPTKLCNHHSRCASPATYRGRCAVHARERDRETHPNKRIYSSKRWRLTRRAKLFRDPICEWPDGCDELATDVHHIIDIQAGGAIWAMANLQALCHGHHSQITKGRQ